MGLFTTLTDADVAALAEGYALPVPLAMQPIAAGTVNSNFALRAGDARWFLRVNEGKQEADVAWEAQLLVALGERGVKSPAPLPTRTGSRYLQVAGKWLTLFPWLEGRHLEAPEVTPATARALGAALGDLHRRSAELPHEWRRPSMYEVPMLQRRFVGFAGSTDPHLAVPIAVIADELDVIAGHDGERRAATHGIIHGDLFRDNVLWRGGDVVALLDFEQASGGSLMYDLAVCLGDWCWPGGGAGGLDRELAGALLAGYRAAVPFGATDQRALLVELRVAAMRFTITRITDVYLAQIDNPAKDFRDYLARLVWLRRASIGDLVASS